MDGIARTQILDTANNLTQNTQIVAALEAIPGYALLVNNKVQIVMANSRFCKEFGVQNGDDLIAMLPGEACRCLSALESGCGKGGNCGRCPVREAALAGVEGRSLELEGEWKTATGSRSFEVFSSPISLFNQSFAVVTLRDISRRRELERIREGLQERLFLSAKITSVGTLAAGMAHEINNPLTIVLGNLSFLTRHLESTNDPKVTRWLAQSQQAAERVAGVVKNIQTFVDRGQTLNTIFDVNAILLRTLNYFRNPLSDLQVEVEMNLTTEILLAEANAPDFQEAIIQLFSNSRDALQEALGMRKLSVTTRAADNIVEILISDTGIGIPTEHLRRIFDPFFTTKEPGKGMGMGLTLVHKTLEVMGGGIDISSAPNQGTTARLYFPRSKVAASGPSS